MFKKAIALSALAAAACLTPFFLFAQDGTDKAPQQEEPDKQPDNRLEALPFPPGEKLTYEIRWSIFPVGTATIEYLGPVELDSKQAYKIVLSARTNSFADGFFKVRNYNASWVDPEFTKPLHYVKLQHEGDEHREVVVTFDWDTNTAQYSDFGNKRDPIDVEPGSWDPLSIVYFVRTLDLSQVEHISVPTTDGKKNMMTEIAVRGVESLKTGAGRFETILVEPDTKDLGGVFKKSKDAGISIWFTNDERQIPVRMSSSVAVGSFIAELVKIEGPDSERYQQEDSDEHRNERRGPRR